MKLNQELLNRIQEEVAFNFFGTEKPKVSKINWKWSNLMNAEKIFLLPEVCRRYSEQIIKCDVCEGSGEREIYHEVCGHSPVVCEFCEGKGYIDEK